jgi:O-antigen/teichoic acid export membrane protein
MPPAKLAASLALLGGVLWILHALLGGGDGTLLDVLHVAGYVCLMGASAVFGTTLVKGDAVGVRAVVGVASALLALSVVEAFRPDGTSWYDGSWGVVAVLLGGLALARVRGRSTARRPAGAHAR